MKYFWLPGSLVFEVVGADSTRYLDARLTNHVKTLEGGRGFLAAALSAQGKTQGFFSVYKLDSVRYLLQSDAGDEAQILAALRQFLVADRVVVNDLSAQYRLVHIIPGSRQPELLKSLGIIGISDLPFALLETDFGFVCRRTRTTQSGLDLLLKSERAADFEQKFEKLKAQPMSEADYTLERIKAGIPAFPTEIIPDSLFAESASQDSVSYSKGCYVGQEVMEKISSHGRSPRVLRRLVVEGKIELVANEVVYQSAEDNTQQAQAAGKILISAFDFANNQTLCFALLRNAENLGNLTTQGRSARIL